ncbi:Na+/H+ antiporter subunit B [Fluviibacterium sp. DFM31]|uniref:Na+/H+ antiporter subunit B n=1 Tax=Meridianimarinicoccus marinus TaxID=3231483 RepID=A0ABV3L350_9RHOB
MKSIILTTATRIIVALLLVFSVYMLLRGHNEPGGGFIGGLIGASGFVLYAIANGTSEARRALRAAPEQIAAVGLGVAALSGLVPGLFGNAAFAGKWLFLGATPDSKGFPISNIIAFDIGVYLVVLGAILTLVFALEEEI